MMSQLKHCNNGPILEKLLLSGYLVKNDSIQLQTYKESLEITNRYSSHKRQRSVMLESVQNISKMILNDKLQIFNSITQSTKLSVTLVQGSTENTEVLLPFWNKYTQE